MDKSQLTSAESQRLNADAGSWHRWGPYLSERQWGTVREDYSAGGNAWDYFPHDHARSRAYRWGEDGIAGICDEEARLCFAIALWNGRDPILKERLFGLTNGEGNHGEDVKEYYFYQDNTPTHSYMRYLYKYPQTAYPYETLIRENAARGRDEGEFELADTGVFENDRYFDVTVEYAKQAPDDICIRLTIENRSAERARLDLLPTLWYRNTWSWDGTPPHGQLDAQDGRIRSVSAVLGEHFLFVEGADELLFTDNETNCERLYGSPSRSAFVKDAFNEYVVHGAAVLNAAQRGTKAAARFTRDIAGGDSAVIRLRLTAADMAAPFGTPFDALIDARAREADAFYEGLAAGLSADETAVMRQALSGLLWSKQYYEYDVAAWLKGDAAEPPPPSERSAGRNSDWQNLAAGHVIIMPDKWEYPWFASWDLAFHAVAVAHADLEFAKSQLLLLTRERYMHPSGRLPAYEWSFSDNNPPVQAWAALQIYRLEKRLTGRGDLEFLRRMFHKLTLNFAWWINREDASDDNLFEGGFLGLDNISVLNRSAIPAGDQLEQADATGWMAGYACNMLGMALELGRQDTAYEDITLKFFEHVLYVVDALNRPHAEAPLWDEADGFYYDRLRTGDGQQHPLKVRSMVGLAPLFAVQVLEPQILEAIEGLAEHIAWVLHHRPALAEAVSASQGDEAQTRRLLGAVNSERLRRILARVLDPDEFLSPFGVRSLSRAHAGEPFGFTVGGVTMTVDYEPAESKSGAFGGNSNWRGPVWIPMNFLLIDALREFHSFLGDDFRVECPVGSGSMLNLDEVADELSARICRLFLRDEQGKRPVYGGTDGAIAEHGWSDNILFFEYFDGDTGAGLGAGHQTGWTALVAVLLRDMGLKKGGRAG